MNKAAIPALLEAMSNYRKLLYHPVMEPSARAALRRCLDDVDPPGQGPWISVDDYMPSTGLLPNGDAPSVLVAWKEGRLEAGLCQVMTSNVVYFAANKDQFTHWMHIPPMPQVKEASNAEG